MSNKLCVAILVLLGLKGLLVTGATISKCHQDTLSLQCSGNQKVIPKRIKAGSTGTTSGCPIPGASVSAVDETRCCQPSDSCIKNPAESEVTDLFYDILSQDTNSVDVTVTIPFILQGCSSAYFQNSTYSVIEYECITASSIMSDLQGTVSGQNVYLRLTDTITDADINNCSLSTDICSSLTIEIVYLHLSCNHVFTIEDENNNYNEDYSCSDNSLTTTHNFPGDDHYATIIFFKGLDIETYAWIKIADDDGKGVTLSCPTQTRQTETCKNNGVVHSVSDGGLRMIITWTTALSIILHNI